MTDDERTHVLLSNYNINDETLPQDVIGNALPPRTLTNETVDTVTYRQMKSHPISLQWLTDIVERNDRRGALNVLRKKYTLRVQKQQLMPLATTVFTGHSTLDYLLLVPKLPGFSVILPPDNHIPPNSWEFVLNLGSSQALKPLKVKVCVVTLNLFIWLTQT